MKTTLATPEDIDEFHAFAETGEEAVVLDRHHCVWVVTEDERADLWAHRVEEDEIRWETVTDLLGRVGPLAVVFDPRSLLPVMSA